MMTDVSANTDPRWCSDIPENQADAIRFGHEVLNMVVVNPTDAGMHSALANCIDQGKGNGGMTAGEAGRFC